MPWQPPAQPYYPTEQFVEVPRKKFGISWAFVAGLSTGVIIGALGLWLYIRSELTSWEPSPRMKQDLEDLQGMANEVDAHMKPWMDTERERRKAKGYQ